jgi:hypothetical protein
MPPTPVAQFLGYSTFISAILMAIVGYRMQWKERFGTKEERESMSLTWWFLGFMILSILLFLGTFVTMAFGV